jgi:hypothetical protein
MRKALVISRFAAKDFPLPGVPNMRPFGLFCQGLFFGGENKQKSKIHPKNK